VSDIVGPAARIVAQMLAALRARPEYHFTRRECTGCGMPVERGRFADHVKTKRCQQATAVKRLKAARWSSSWSARSKLRALGLPFIDWPTVKDSRGSLTDDGWAPEWAAWFAREWPMVKPDLADVRAGRCDSSEVPKDQASMRLFLERAMADVTTMKALLAVFDMYPVDEDESCSVRRDANKRRVDAIALLAREVFAPPTPPEQEWQLTVLSRFDEVR
jgi:hypothetical protein